MSRTRLGTRHRFRTRATHGVHCSGWKATCEPLFHRSTSHGGYMVTDIHGEVHLP